ncbi:MAG: methyl-accepting chemotaxis protein [Spirochaetes bacterium]|nr:methyl-accepting chemotaxis protein [Spirochaetota bacterium]
MYNASKLAPVIGINEEKCINCYACITDCPVKYCMDGSGKTLMINHDLCIACGHCIAVCSHKARHHVDDTARFLSGLKRGEKIVAVVAPAVAAVFPGNYLKLNGYLKSLGVEALFDVSFGAELTVVSYVNYIKEKKPKMVIAQPCPAIVNFIQIYHPKLIPYLAPADSPILHSIKMIKEYFPQYRTHKVAVISPCLAKKREFEETGLGDYNVTMLALKEMLEQQKIDLTSFPNVEYTGPIAERAVSFPAPGGLLDTVERFVPGIRRNTRKIEGVQTIYHYLEGVAKCLEKPDIEFPLLVDCLNCEMGCIGGPGTGKDKVPLDELETLIRKRSRELEKRLNPKQKERLYKKYHNLLNKYWKPGMYDRKYQNFSASYSIKLPSETELKEVYRSLKKNTEKDLYDCTACGYHSCRKMAVAIFNKLNKRENCAHYNLILLEEERKTVKYINQHFKEHIAISLDAIEKINNLVAKLDTSISTQSNAVNDSSAVTEKIVTALKNSSELSRQKQESIMELIDNAAKGQEAMKETVQAVQDISQSVEGISSAIKIISAIAANTNLLSMNAAIEAAHAGDAGKGFAVVADEIRRLSESTRENSRNISQTLSDIISGINTTSRRTNDTGIFINDMSEEINGFGITISELIGVLTKLSAESSEITNALQNLQDISSAVKNDYSEMMSLTDIVRYEVNYLAAMSADIVRAIEENNQEIIHRLIAKEQKKQ